MKELESLLEDGEGGNVEFKRDLNKSEHIDNNERMNSLAGQMRNRVILGDGEALYCIGVSDDGDIVGIKDDVFSETLEVLSKLAKEVGASIENVEYKEISNTSDKVGIVKISENNNKDESNQIIVGTAGHVDHGKSSLVSAVVSGEEDDGKGHLRKRLDVLPHEIERGLSADISYSVYGFDENNDIVHLNRESEKEKVVEKSEKLISFVDTVGHQSWISTAIRGLVGQNLDYGLLTIAADEGPTKTTQEHLGILLAVDLPVIVAITKTDLVDEEEINDVEKSIEKMLKSAGCRSMNVNRHGIEESVDSVIKSVEKDDMTIAPIIRTSSVNRNGINDLHYLFKNLPKNNINNLQDSEFRMYIDETYNVNGVGKVVSGTIRSGSISKNEEVLIGPDKKGNYYSTKVKSIEMHYHKVPSAKEGEMVAISISTSEDIDIQRGMILTSEDNPKITKEFEAEIMVLNHPTSITNGYEPVIQLESISESAEVITDKPLRAGDVDTVKFKFKFKPHNIKEGQNFVFREGETKGVGKVTKLIN